MKKTTLFFLLLLFVSLAKAQITFDAIYSGETPNLDKFHQSGFKYVRNNLANSQIEIYNVNHTLFKLITIPTQTLPIHSIRYVSEKLFNTDTLMEYTLTNYLYQPGAPIYQFRIYNENGALMMFRDSAAILPININIMNNVFNTWEAIYYDGLNTKMQLMVGISPNVAYKTAVYTLPGTIPCVQCSEPGTGNANGIQPTGGVNSNNPVFYPNPVTDHLKLKYELPVGYKKAEIKIYDVQSKLIEEMKVTDTFDFIYLPSNYNNGLYLYQLVVDGKTVKTEKIILDK